MNATYFLPLLLFALACLFLLPDMALGGEAGLQANLVWNFAADRARMIQISLVFVLLGCALLWWTK